MTMPPRDPVTGRFLRRDGRQRRRSHSFTLGEVETLCSVLASLSRGGDPRLLMRRPEMIRIMRRFVMMRGKLSSAPAGNSVAAGVVHGPAPLVTVRRWHPGEWKGYLAVGED